MTLHTLWPRLKQKGLRYWVTAVIIFILTFTASPYVYEYLQLTQARTRVFQQLLDWGPYPAEPKFVRVVLIEDNEYWLGELAGRRPIKRNYLAGLIDKLAKENVQVIAIDFDIRSPNPRSTEIPKEYEEETISLIRSIAAAAKQGIKIVLATPTSWDEAGRYQQDADPFQGYGLCKRGAEATRDAAALAVGLDQKTRQNITCGFIALPFDPLVIPTRIALTDGTSLDSFALAMATAAKPEVIEHLLKRIGSEVRYANFIPERRFNEFGTILSATDLRTGAERKPQLAHQIVIVGARWSTFAAGRGAQVDRHWTPVGWIVGALLHANYVEAMLGSRIFGAVPHSVLSGTEIAVGVICAIAFALIPGFLGKLGGVILLLVLLFFLQWAALHGFGIFFDVFVPVLGLGLHALYGKLFEPSEAAPAEHSSGIH